MSRSLSLSLSRTHIHTLTYTHHTQRNIIQPWEKRKPCHLPQMDLWASQVALVVENPPSAAGDMRHGFNPCVGKICWRRAWQPTPVCLPRESMDRGVWPGTVQGSHRVRHDWCNLACAHTQMDLYGIMLSEISKQRKKNTVWYLLSVETTTTTRKSRPTERESRTVVTRSRGWGKREDVGQSTQTSTYKMKF